MDRAGVPATLRTAESVGRRLDGAEDGAERFICDICRRELVNGQGYYELEMGMNDEVLYVGGPQSLVQETSLIVICKACEPMVSARIDALLEALWNLRVDEPVSEPPGATPPAPVPPGAEPAAQSVS